jgi:hypothetical protein
MSDHVQQATKALSASQMMIRNGTHECDAVSATALVGIGHALLAVAEELAGASGTGSESPALHLAPPTG